MTRVAGIMVMLDYFVTIGTSFSTVVMIRLCPTRGRSCCVAVSLQLVFASATSWAAIVRTTCRIARRATVARINARARANHPIRTNHHGRIWLVTWIPELMANALTSSLANGTSSCLAACRAGNIRAVASGNNTALSSADSTVACTHTICAGCSAPAHGAHTPNGS